MPDARSKSSLPTAPHCLPPGKQWEATDERRDRRASHILSLRPSAENTEPIATQRSLQRLLLPVTIAFSVLSWACEPQATICAVDPSELRELDGTRLLQALAALEPHLGENAELIELRATGQSLTLQVVQPPPPSADESATVPPGASPPLRVLEFRYVYSDDLTSPGALREPTVLPLLGTGEIQENAFPLREIDLSRITQAFPLAQKAVDPLDGKVEELVVRRFLPFHRAVRARIFIDSPRMSGSIDTNASGAPLKP